MPEEGDNHGTGREVGFVFTFFHPPKTGGMSGTARVCSGKLPVFFENGKSGTQFITFLFNTRISPHEDDLMNGPSFGDTRDLFKFDLVRHIMKAIPVFDSFTFIPMLTDTPVQASGKRSAARDLKKATKSGRAGKPQQGSCNPHGAVAGDRRRPRIFPDNPRLFQERKYSR